LDKEKEGLVTELSTLRETFDQLLGEDRVKKERNYPKMNVELNYRRSILYQSQIIQLKRQMDSYKKIAMKNELFVYSAQEQLLLIIERFQKYILTLDKSQKTAELQQLLKRIEALASHIVRQERDHIESNRDPQFQFISEFITGGVTLDQVSKGSIDHLNLKHVSRLEIQLQKLYAQLSELGTCLSTSLEPNIAPIFQGRIQTVFENSMDQLLLSMNSLLSLSCLLPVAPLPSLEKIKNLGKGSIPSFFDILKKCEPPLSEATVLRLQPVLGPLFSEIQKQMVV
jgi:hypothetical protein